VSFPAVFESSQRNPSTSASTTTSSTGTSTAGSGTAAVSSGGGDTNTYVVVSGMYASMQTVLQPVFDAVSNLNLQVVEFIGCAVGPRHYDQLLFSTGLLLLLIFMPWVIAVILQLLASIKCMAKPFASMARAATNISTRLSVRIYAFCVGLSRRRSPHMSPLECLFVRVLVPPPLHSLLLPLLLSSSPFIRHVVTHPILPHLIPFSFHLPSRLKSSSSFTPPLPPPYCGPGSTQSTPRTMAVLLRSSPTTPMWSIRLFQVEHLPHPFPPHN
jgi:hypothetical protein